MATTSSPARIDRAENDRLEFESSTESVVNRTFEIAWSADVADLSNWDARLLEALTRLGIGSESGRENHRIRLRLAELDVLIRDLDFVLDLVLANRAKRCAGNELHAVLA